MSAEIFQRMAKLLGRDEVMKIIDESAKGIAIAKISQAKTEQELRAIASQAAIILATIQVTDLIKAGTQVAASYTLDAFIAKFPDSAAMIDFLRNFPCPGTKDTTAP